MQRFTEQAGKLMETANMFSVPDEMLQECEDITDPGAWRNYIVKTLRGELDRQLSNDPAYRFDKGRLAARKLMKKDRGAALAVQADAALAAGICRTVWGYRSTGQLPGGSGRDTFVQLKNRDDDFAAGYLYGMLENMNEATIDEKRPFANPVNGLVWARAMTELQILQVHEGKPLETDARALAAAQHQTGAGMNADERKLMTEVAALERQLNGSAMSAVAVHDAIDRLANEYWTKMRVPGPSDPLVLGGLLRVLDLADRQEKGMLDDFRSRLGTQYLPSAMRAIAGAA
jgi:hypothetical protein